MIPLVWIRITIANFFVAGMMGLLLRFMQFAELPGLNFSHLVHGHSHLALTGWAYLAIYILILHNLNSKVKLNKKFFAWLFWITQLSATCMAISFPIQGYAFWSIVSSTLYILCAYIFFTAIWRHLNKMSVVFSTTIKAAIIFFVFSTVGLWAMPMITTAYPGDQQKIMLIVHFFLHFKINGWFVMAALALVLSNFKSQTISSNPKAFRSFITFFAISVVFTFSTTLPEYEYNSSLILLNVVGVVSQAIAIVFLIKILTPDFRKVLKMSHWLVRYLIIFAISAFLFKAVIQTLLVFPDVAKMAFQTRILVVAYLHLVMLGVVTLLLLSDYIQHFIPAPGKLIKTGSLLILSGFLLTEIILFVQGWLLWNNFDYLPFYFQIVFAVSNLLVIGTALFYFGLRKKVNT